MMATWRGGGPLVAAALAAPMLLGCAEVRFETVRDPRSEIMASRVASAPDEAPVISTAPTVGIYSNLPVALLEPLAGALTGARVVTQLLGEAMTVLDPQLAVIDVRTLRERAAAAQTEIAIAVVGDEDFLRVDVIHTPSGYVFETFFASDWLGTLPGDQTLEPCARSLDVAGDELVVGGLGVTRSAPFSIAPTPAATLEIDPGNDTVNGLGFIFLVSGGGLALAGAIFAPVGVVLDEPETLGPNTVTAIGLGTAGVVALVTGLAMYFSSETTVRVVPSDRRPGSRGTR